MPFPQGLRRPETLAYVKAAEGLDSIRTDLDIGYKSDKAQNLRFDVEVGAVTKRAAVSYFNTSVQAAPPSSIYRYYREAINTSYLIGLCGTSLRSSTTGTFAEIATLSGSGGRKFTAVTYNDLAIISTGYDNIIQTDGTVGWELGSCKAVGTATGGSIPAGVHIYKIVYLEGVREIINGALSNTVTTTGATSHIDLSYIPLGTDSCTERKVYRSDAGGAYNLVATYNESTGIWTKFGGGAATGTMTTLEDVIATPGAPVGINAVNSDMPKGLYLYLAQERLFVANDPTGLVGRSSTVYYSDQFIPAYINTQSPDLTTTDAASNYEVIYPNDNDVITGLINYLSNTYVFKRNNIRPWEISGTPNTWEVGDIVSIIGCPAPYTIQATGGGIIYQGWDRMYVFNGQYSTNIIDDFTFDENFLDSRRADNVGYFWNNLYLLAYTDANSGSSYCNKVLLYDIIRKQTAIDIGGQLQTQATPPVPIPGAFMNVGCFTSFKGTGEWGQLYAGDSVFGWVYQYDRTISSNQISTKSAFDLGTYSGSYASLPEENTILSGPVLDNMEAYQTDELAQAAWVTDQPATGGSQVPPYLGTGVDGAVVISVDTTLTDVKNYTALTVDAGVTLTATGLPIYCLGVITINGTVKCNAIYAHTVTVSGTGVIQSCSTIKANTINNAGNMATDMITQATYTTSFTGKCYTPDCSSNQSGYLQVRVASPDGSIGTGVGTNTWIFLSSVNISSVTTGATYSSGSAPGGSGSAIVQLQISGEWITASSGANVTGVREVATSTIAVDGYWDVGVLAPIHAYQTSSCFYVASSGTVPTSGDITDYVPALQVYSNTSEAIQGSYALKAVCMAGLTAPIISKTLSQVFDLSVKHTVLVDVMALRAGVAIIQLGLGTTAGTIAYVNIPVTVANTWETKAIVMPVNATVQYMAIKFLDTTASNIVYLDNIRPSAYPNCSYLSSVFTINAQSMGSMYWNEILTANGTVALYTRTGAIGKGGVGAPFTDWTDDTGWSAALTSQAGSLITSAANIYLQIKVVLSSTDATGINFPSIIKATGYNIKFTYWKVKNTAEAAVEFIYRTGWRNFDLAFDDKIYRKIILLYQPSIEAPRGYIDNVIVECGAYPEGAPKPSYAQSYTFTSVSLDDNLYRWYSTLPDNMYGKELRLTVYKNDPYDFRLRQFGFQVETIGLI